MRHVGAIYRLYSKIIINNTVQTYFIRSSTAIENYRVVFNYNNMLAVVFIYWCRSIQLRNHVLTNRFHYLFQCPNDI